MNRILSSAAIVLAVANIVVLVVVWRGLADLRRDVAELRAQSSRAPDSARNTKSAAPGPVSRSPLSASAGNNTDAALPEGDGKSGTADAKDKAAEAKDKALEDSWMGAGKDEVKRRVSARLTGMQQRFKLRPEQVQSLQTRADEKVDSLLAAFERTNTNNGRPPDLGLLMDWLTGNLRLPLEDLLDAGQKEEFKRFAEEDRASRLENLVNIELMEMQGAMHLTPEQKDQVFAKLTEVIAAEDAAGAAYYADDAQFGARIVESLRQRREALQSILDASQAAAYANILEDDRKLIDRMFRGGTAADSDPDAPSTINSQPSTPR